MLQVTRERYAQRERGRDRVQVVASSMSSNCKFTNSLMILHASLLIADGKDGFDCDVASIELPVALLWLRAQGSGLQWSH
jgi:hypothetical protein